MENSVAGTSIDIVAPATSIVVTDPDTSSKFTFEINQQPAGSGSQSRDYRIDSNTGIIYAEVPFDRETENERTVVVRVTDEGIKFVTVLRCLGIYCKKQPLALKEVGANT